ncbi:MAG: hypothetical protein PVJ49_15580 [Acidobacteriota bacterium]|jgi:hypothetical protein
MALKDCCAQEAERSLRKHRDVAVCDGCGRLVLAYGDETTFQLTVDELDAKDVGYDTGRHGNLWIVAKER